MRNFFLFIASLLAKKNLYLSKSLSLYSGSIDLEPNLDFVRYTTLELCAHEIRSKSIPGNIAEVGVYKGNFAQKLNILFPNRTLYLFDTFEGFDKKDITIDKLKNYSTGEQDFSDTSVEFVLNKMPNRNNCKVMKGFFPATAEDVHDTFCFVSLDPDLYQPIYDGLCFFYPKLVRGGYIFIHDFNNSHYKGARQAVEDFCAMQGIGFVPIPDNAGTAIITK